MNNLIAKNFLQEIFNRIENEISLKINSVSISKYQDTYSDGGFYCCKDNFIVTTSRRSSISFENVNDAIDHFLLALDKIV